MTAYVISNMIQDVDHAPMGAKSKELKDGRRMHKRMHRQSEQTIQITKKEITR